MKVPRPSGIKATLKRPWPTPSFAESDKWRWKPFYIIFLASLVVEILVLFYSIFRPQTGQQDITSIALQCFGVILLLISLLWRSRSLETRIWLGIASLYSVAIMLFLFGDSFRGGEIVLFTASLASVLISTASGVILTGLNFILLLSLGRAALAGLVSWGGPEFIWDIWLIDTISYCVFTAVLTISASLTINVLKDSLISAERNQVALKHRLEMEQLGAIVSTQVGSARYDQLDEGIDWALQALGETTQVDRTYLFDIDPVRRVWNNTHEWCAPGITPQKDSLQNLPMDDLRWWADKIEANEPIIMNDIEIISDSEPAIYALLHEQGIQSMLVVPLLGEDAFYGFIGFDSVRNKRQWSVADVDLLRTVASIFAGRKKRAQYEQEIIEGEKRYRMLVENSPLSVVLLDEQGHVLEANAKARHLRSISQLKPGKSLLDIQGLVDAGFTENFKRCLLEGVPYSDEIQSTQDPHIAYWTRYYLVRLDMSENQPNRVLLLIQDISREHALEEALNRSQRMEALGRLAGGVAHDFNNLLTVINGYTEMMIETADLDPTFKEDLNTIAEAGNKASKLTSQLLLFSRRQETRAERIDANQLLQDMNRLLKRFLDETIQLELDHADEPCYIQADQSQIEQVIVNLVVNARDAMPEGGKIRVGTRLIIVDEETALAIPNAKTGLHVQLFVQDTGTGMTPEVLQHIFEPFFTTKAENRGTGLGLATAYGIVTKFDGHITVDSEPGKGSIFYINIPFNNDETWQNDATAEAISDHAYSSEQYTILLVEDDATVRRLVKRSLENMNYTVNDAPSADAALEMLQSGLAVDLVISDVVMPGMSGIKLARALRELRSDTPIILMSGYPQELNEVEDIRDEGVPLLLKPVKRQDLQNMIRQVLG